MTLISKKLMIGAFATSLLALSGASAFAAPQMSGQLTSERLQAQPQQNVGKFIQVDTMQRDGDHTGAPRGSHGDPWTPSRGNYNSY